MNDDNCLIKEVRMEKIDMSKPYINKEIETIIKEKNIDYNAIQ